MKQNGPMDDDDFDSLQLDPGIRAIVMEFRANGFTTTDSGDGISKHEQGIDDEGTLDCPHVFMEVEPAEMKSEADRLQKLVESDPSLAANTIEVAVSYAPADGIAILQWIGKP